MWQRIAFVALRGERDGGDGAHRESSAMAKAFGTVRRQGLPGGMPPAAGQGRRRPVSGFGSLPQAIKDTVSRSAREVIENRFRGTPESAEEIKAEVLHLRQLAGMTVSRVIGEENGLSEDAVRENVPDLLYIIEIFGENLPDALIVDLLKHPHLLAAAKREDVADMLIENPRIVENLQDAPYLVAHLYNFGLEELGSYREEQKFLERKEIVRELDMNELLRERVLGPYARLLSLFEGRVDLLRELSLWSENIWVVLEGYPNLGRALLSTERPVREVHRLDGEAALIATLVDFSMRGIPVPTDFPYGLLFDRRLMAALRPYGRLWPALLAVPGLLERTQREVRAGGRPDTALPLLASPDLLEVLPYASHLGARLVQSPELLSAAVGNADVATVLSWRHEYFDDIPDAALGSALRTASLPAGKRTPLTPDEISSLQSELLLENFILANPGLGIASGEFVESLRRRVTENPALLYKFIDLGDDLKGHLLAPLLSDADSGVNASAAASTVPIEYLPAMLRSLDALDQIRPGDVADSELERTRAQIFSVFRGMPEGFDRHPQIRELLYATFHQGWYIDTVPGLRDALIADSRLAGAAKHLSSALPVLLVRRPETLQHLVRDDLGLLSILLRHPFLALEFLPEGSLEGIVSRLSAVPGLMSRLLDADVDLSPWQWLRLWNDEDLLAALHEDLVGRAAGATPTGRALLRSENLAEAVISPGFAAVWRENREAYDQEAGKKDRNGASALRKKIREDLGGTRLSAEGLPIDEGLRPVLDLLASTDRFKPANLANRLKALLPEEEIQRVIGIYTEVGKERELAVATSRSTALTQAVYFTPGFHQLLQSDGRLLALWLRDPHGSAIMLRDRDLLKLLIDSQDLRDQFADDYTRTILISSPETVAAMQANPDLATLHYSSGRLPYGAMLHWDEGAGPLRSFVERSRPAAAAIARTMPAAFNGEASPVFSLSGSPDALKALAEAADNTVAALLATGGRIAAIRQTGARAVRELDGLPEVARVLARRADVFTTTQEFTGLLDKLGAFREHPATAADVLPLPAALDILATAPAFVTVLAQVPGRLRAGLTANEALIELVLTRPGFAEDLAAPERSGLRGLFLSVARERLSALLRDRPEVADALIADPRLAEQLHRKPSLVGELDREAGTALWPTVIHNPALLPHLRHLRRTLARATAVTALLGRTDLRLDADSARLLQSALRNHEVIALLEAESEFGALFLERPEWQRRAVNEVSFTSAVRGLLARDRAAFTALARHTDPGRLLAAVEEPRPPLAGAEGSGAAVPTSAMPAPRSAAPAARPPVAGREVTPPKQAPAAEPAPTELALLVGGTHGAALAAALRRSPELLVFLEEMPSLADELILRPDRLDDYLFRRHLESWDDGMRARTGDGGDTVLGPLSLGRAFDDFMASVDPVLRSPDAYDRLRRAAAVTWNEHVREHEAVAARERQEREALFTRFQAARSSTWTLSGRVHYLNRLTAESFTEEQAATIAGLAQAAQGQREKGAQVAVNTPLHGHLDSGSGGISFFWALAGDGKVDLAVYAFSTARSGNDYWWGGSSYTAGPQPLLHETGHPVFTGSKRRVEQARAGAVPDDGTVTVLPEPVPASGEEAERA
ncbi:hypothetical protein ABZX29_31120, partial [Streptomyces zhihengii]